MCSGFPKCNHFFVFQKESIALPDSKRRTSVPLFGFSFVENYFLSISFPFQHFMFRRTKANWSSFSILPASR